MFTIIAAMVAMWLAVVVYRQEIRVRWWGYRLRTTESVADRMYYVQLLAGARETALPVVRNLLEDEEPGVRSFAVVLANAMPGGEATDLLMRASRDEDASVRESAIVGLGMRDQPGIAAHLRALADHSDTETAMLATHELVSVGTPEALAALDELIRSHSSVPVRAEAVETLGEWGGDEVLGSLIAALEDEAVYAGLTVSQKRALGALEAVAPHLAGEQPPGGLAAEPRTIGERAATALRRLTGQEFGYLEAAPDARRAAVEAWRRWYEDRSSENGTE